jgi:hypothetical protein
MKAFAVICCFLLVGSAFAKKNRDDSSSSSSSSSSEESNEAQRSRYQSYSKNAIRVNGKSMNEFFCEACILGTSGIKNLIEQYNFTEVSYLTPNIKT